jgi:hypothetical protein
VGISWREVRDGTDARGLHGGDMREREGANSRMLQSRRENAFRANAP